MDLQSTDLSELPVSNGFRLRGVSMTRMETFTDAAFAIAASLMVISVGDVPAKWDDLVTALLGIPAFALALLVMMLFWYAHHIWSRRYGLDDLTTIWLSGLLILLILVYVYPLKFMANGFVTWVTDGAVTTPTRISSLAELYQLFVVYSGGLLLMSLLIVLLYGHAWRRRLQLRLSQLELSVTRHEILGWSIMSTFCLLSLLTALILPPIAVPVPGIVLSGLGVAMPVFGIWSNKRLQRMRTTA